jgi:hypothetical protein
MFSPRKTPPSGAAAGKPPLSRHFLLWLSLLFLFSAGLGFGLWQAGCAVAAYLLIALAPSIVLFGVLKSVGTLKTKNYQYSGPASLFMIIFLLLLRTYPPSGEGIRGMVYVDNQPATAGVVYLLNSGLSDNRRDFSDANPGHVEFHGVTGLRGDVLEFQIDVDKPVDLPPTRVEWPRSRRDFLLIRLTNPKPEEKSGLVPEQDKAAGSTR